MAEGTVKPKATRWFWPPVDSAVSAQKAAKNGGVAYGLIAIGYLMAIILLSAGVDTPLTPASPDSTQYSITLWVDVLIGALAAYLAWRTYRGPTLLLCSIALAWTVLEFAAKAVSMGMGPNGNGFGMYWSQVIGTIAAIAGLRGAIAARKFERNSPPT